MTLYAHFNVLLRLYDVLGDLQPQPLPELAILLRRHVRVRLRQVQIALLEGQIHATLPETHFRVDMDTRLHPLGLLAEP